MKSYKSAGVFLGYLMFACCFWLAIFSRPATADVPGLIEQTKPSVVVIGTYSKTRSPPFVVRGTGFVVDNGRVVATNAHVLPDVLDSTNSETLIVLLPSSQQHRAAKAIANDKAHDLALIELEGSPLVPLPLQETRKTREGQSVIFMGFPIGGVLGFTPVTHRAMISAITPIAIPGASANQINGKTISRIRGGNFNVFQLDGTAYPGNSGGPLIDVDTGEVVGIINMVFVKATKESVLSQPSGISFAIPVEHLIELLKSRR